MPGRPWNAAATAPPVSPEVATRIVSGFPDLCGRRANAAARKHAPTSLNAAVGPWKSSSTAASSPLPSGVSGVSGTGKLNASATIASSSGASASPAKKGCSRRRAVSGSVVAASKSAVLNAGNSTGT